jgi:probable H4MPT-linked C1 transfer pathway protein
MNIHNQNQAGWDIGGAHVKLALLSNNKLHVYQWYCPLWRGIHELDNIFDVALLKMHGLTFSHNVTMTGELADCFESKADGVQQIVNAFTHKMTGQDDIRFFTKKQMLNAQQAVDAFQQIASANWLASGVAVSTVCDDGLFVDMGSTTTDLLMIKDKHVQNFADSDFGRLRSGELVYTGVVRSCVNTVCHQLSYRGELIPMMAEYFANTADVYRILNVLPAHADLGETCDGREKNVVASIKRLARMIGIDIESLTQEEILIWQTAAQYIAEQQKQMLRQQVQRFFYQHGCAKKIIGAGVGRFLVKELAHQLNVEYIDFSELLLGQLAHYDTHAADCAPAVSLAIS